MQTKNIRSVFDAGYANMATTNSIYCPACEAKTNISVTAEESRQTGGLQWQIGECNSSGCAQRFLICRHLNTGQILEVWPRALAKPVDKAIPEQIRVDLEEAYRCMTVVAYRGAATLARRAMQSVAIDYGAPTTKDILKKSGGTKKKKVDLIEQIDWLEKERIITPQLRAWAHDVRTIGNIGAHPADAEDDAPMSEDDANDVLEFVEAVCSALYITNQRYQARHTPKTSETADAAA